MDERLQEACAIATGKQPAGEADTGIEIVASRRDLSCRMRGEETHRMVWRGAWTYVSRDYLPARGYRAAERRCSTMGSVYHGEIVVEHPRGGRVESAWLVVVGGHQELAPIPHTLLRDGRIRFTLPDGEHVDLEDPRGRS